MRSRYTAYVRGEVAYLLATHHPDTVHTVDPDAVARRARGTRWLGLEIVETVAGAASDDRGVVEFIARGIVDQVPFAQRERSRFRKHAGAWFYVDAEPPGRNAPCPCGSGDKYKHCHGRA
jgi:SEC-C motif domain protein